MAKMMKAAVVRKFTEPLSIEEMTVPEVGRGQILVKIEACGVFIRTYMPRMATGRSNRSRPSFPVMKASGQSPLWARA